MRIEKMSIWACVALICIANAPVMAGHLPTHGVVHLDLNIANGFTRIGPGGAAALEVAGVDTINNNMQPWHWENEFRNPNAAMTSFPLIFAVGGFGGVGGRVVQAGVLTLPAMGMAGDTVSFDIHSMEHMQIFPAGADVGAFFLAVNETQMGGVRPSALLYDGSVTEGMAVPDVIPPRPTWEPMSPDSIRGMSHYTITVSQVPEPETYALMLAGLGIVGFVARGRGKGNGRGG